MSIEKISLAAARKNAHLTQEDLAKKCGVSKWTVSNWERYRREPTVSQAKQIGAACGISYDDIIFLPKSTV